MIASNVKRVFTYEERSQVADMLLGGDSRRKIARSLACHAYSDALNGEYLDYQNFTKHETSFETFATDYVDGLSIADAATKWNVAVDLPALCAIYRFMESENPDRIPGGAAKPLETEPIIDEAVEFKISEDGATAYSVSVPGQINTLEKFLEALDPDLEQWEMKDGHRSNMWHTTAIVDGAVNQVENWQFRVDWKRRVGYDNAIDLKALKNDLKDELREMALADRIWENVPRTKSTTRDTLAIVNLPDLHLGKLAWVEETGQRWDLDEAKFQFWSALERMMDNVDTRRPARILFPVGNDLLHTSDSKNQTFKGTPMDSSHRFKQVFKEARVMMAEAILELSRIAPVDVPVIAGNHGGDAEFMLGDALECYFHTYDGIEVQNSPAPRTTYQWGETGFLMAHGHHESPAQLKNMFTYDFKQLWNDTKFHEAMCGHFHKKGEKVYDRHWEDGGFVVRYWPSLCGSDNWHNEKGFKGLQRSEVRYYDILEGDAGNFPVSIIER